MILATVAGNILLDHCPLSARFPEADLTFKAWQGHVSTPEIVFLGSSRTGNSINVDIIAPKVRQISGDASVQLFNAAVPAGDPPTMEFIGAHLFTGGRLPKLAIIEITPDSVARRNRFLDFAVTRQFTFWDVIKNSGDISHSTHRTISRVISSRLIPFYTHRNAARIWARNAWFGPEKTPAFTDPENVFYDGYLGRAEPLNDVLDPPPEERVQHDVPRVRKQLADYEIPGRTSAALEALVARCHRGGMKIILLETPMHSKYRAVFTPSITLPYNQFVKHLTDTYGCRFVDCSDRVPDAMFIDGVHAKDKGRTYFSGLFAEEVLGPAWRAEARLPHE